VYIDPNKTPQTADHVKDAQASGQPDVLTVQRPGADDRRADAQRGTPTVPGQDRDEYPPATTAEGGAGASIRHVGSSDNRSAGSSLGNQIRNLPDGTKIKVNVSKKPNEQ
jgi:hypothetical protein